MTDWKEDLKRLTGDDPRVLRDGIRALAHARKKPHRLALHEQPFDSQLLQGSRLFARSRRMYLDQGGRFFPTLISSGRTLTSPSLLEQEIQYTPIERELVWAATDPIESSNPKRLARLLATRLYCTSLFHEQNHRILWHFLPPPPRSRIGISRYLNFVESLVVTMDMALGDELGAGVSQVFYLAGLTYAGMSVQRECLPRRVYRNYLHACLYATYLCLECYSKRDIHKAVLHLYPTPRDLSERAVRRALRLDRKFVMKTNPTWQRKHAAAVIRKLATSSKNALLLPSDPLDNRLQYLWTERWFEKMGV